MRETIYTVISEGMNEHGEQKKRSFEMCGSYCPYSRVFEEAERLTEKI